MTQTIAGKDAVVNCPTGHVYSGTNLMCGIVDKFCFAKSYEEIREANCHFQYEYVMAGSNIEFWPPKVRPELRDPSKDPEQELLEAHQLTTAAHLAAASALMNLRKQELEILQRHQAIAKPNPEGNPRALSQGGSGSDIVKRVLPHIVHIDELRCVPISGEDSLVDKFGRLYSTEDAVFSEDGSIVNGLLVTIGIAAVSVVLFVMCAYRCQRRPVQLEDDLSEFGPGTE